MRINKSYTIVYADCKIYFKYEDTNRGKVKREWEKDK